MESGERYCRCGVCQLVERRSVRTLLWGIDELLKGITFAGILALTITIVAGSPHQLFVTPKTAQRVEQLTELRRQLTAVTRQLDNLSQENDRLFTHLVHAASPAPGLPAGSTAHRRMFYLAGAAPPPLDSSLSAVTRAAERLRRHVARKQQTARKRAEWLEQSPIVLPADGAIASGFGMRHHPVHNEPRMHEGIDIRIPGGTPVLSTGAGLVTMADTADGYGSHVRIYHPATGHLTLYAHLSRIPGHIKPGQWVSRGNIVGYSGDSGVATGPHLHYEIRNADGHPLNPMNFLLPPRQRQASHRQQAFARMDSLLLQTGV